MKNSFRTSLFKILVMVMLVALLSMTAVACNPDEEPSEPDAPNYPDGAIALTKDNLYDYFDVKVKTDCFFDYSHDTVFPTATTYVAFVAKNGYTEVSGEVKYTVNTKVYQASNYSFKMPVESEEQSVILYSTGYQSESYNVTYAQPSYDEFKVENGTDSVTINSVYGYVILGESYTPTDYEKLLESDFANSDSLRGEVEDKIQDLAMGIAMGTTKNYWMGASSGFSFTSVYGSGRSLSAGTSSSIKADVEGYKYSLDGEVYYYNVDDGKVHHQYKNKFGLVIEETLDLERSDLLSEMLPPFDDLVDDNAVYVKKDGVYYAYTILTNTAEIYKDTFVESFEALGIDCDYDRVYVTYTYDFTDGFSFNVKVNHKDLKQAEYVDNSLFISLEMSDVNQTSFDVYTPDESTFALATDLDKAMEFKPGMVTVDSTTESFDYVVSQDEYEDGQRIDNWLPVHITEGGLYTFTSTDNGNPYTILSIRDAEGNPYYDKYFTSGIYYFQHAYVPYGMTTLTMTVESVILEDYGDLSNPTEITDGTFTATLERVGDMQAFSFTPAETGIYVFTPTSGYDVAIEIYDGNLDHHTYVNTASSYNTCYFEAGEAYVLEVKYQRGNEEDLIYDCTLTNVGNPSSEPQEITADWQYYFVGNGEFGFYFDVVTPGYYALEFERIDGVDPSGYSVDDADGEYYSKTVTVDNTTYYVLEEGRYYFNMYGGGERMYFKGNVRLLLFREAVQAEQSVELSFDDYLDLAINLPTNNSYVDYVFEVTEDCHLLREGYNCTLYKADGVSVVKGSYTRDIFFDKACVVKSNLLEAGTYILHVANYSNGGAVEGALSLRLQDVEEREVLYHYMIACGLSKSDVSIREYYTNMDGAEFFMVDIGEYEQTSRTEAYGDYVFHYEDTNQILVYVNGEFHTLLSAYENNLITNEALENVYLRHKYFNPDNYAE